MFPLRIYTALKPVPMPGIPISSLFPLRIYTALKPYDDFSCIGHRLFPLRIYTALKQTCIPFNSIVVCFPYEFTLLSNWKMIVYTFQFVCFPYEFTLLSNIRICRKTSKKFVSPTNLHCSQTLTFSCRSTKGLFPLRIYTALKLRALAQLMKDSLFPLRIYTALKRGVSKTYKS